MPRKPTLRPRRVQRELASMGTHHDSLRRHPPAPAACSLPPCRRCSSSYLDRFIVYSATAPPCNNGPAPRPPRLDLSSSNMASRDESGEPGASLSLPGSAGPISPTAPIRSLGSATDTRHPLLSISLPAAPVRLPDDGVLSRSLATRAVQRPLPGDGRRLCSAARAPNTHRLRTRPGHQAQTSPSLAWEAEMCLLACDVATHAPTTTYEMHRLGGSECDVCSCRLGRGGGLLRDASFDQGTGRDLDCHHGISPLTGTHKQGHPTRLSGCRSRQSTFHRPPATAISSVSVCAPAVCSPSACRDRGADGE